MPFDIVVRDKIATSIESKLKRIQIQANSTNAALSRMRGLMGGLGRNIGVGTANRSFAALSTNVRKTNTQIASLNAGLSRASLTARRLLSGALLLQATDGFVGALDSYQNLQNRLIDVSKVKDDKGIVDAIRSQERLNEVTRELFNVATRARVPVSSLAKTYRRLDASLKATGATQKETLRITETAGKLLSLAGANAGEASSALLQLSQAFNKGKLDGDEFRTVAELMPQVIDAISNSLGISRKEIFDYSKEGKITVDILRQAFGDLATQVDEDFKRLPRTIGNAFTELVNTITRAFGQSGGGKSFIDHIISGIDWIKNNLPTVVRLLKTFAAVLVAQGATSYIVGLVSSLTSFSGWLNIAGQGITAVTAYFVFFADQIKVTADGVVTLQDVFTSLWQIITTAVSGGGSIFGDLFNIKGAQKAFDFIVEGLKKALSLVLDIGSAGVALYNTFMSMSWGDIWNLFAEVVNAGVTLLGNGAIEVFALVVKAGLFAIDKLRNGIIGVVQHIVSVIAFGLSQLFKSLGNEGLGLAVIAMAADFNRELRKYKDIDIDKSLKLTDAIRSAKTDISTLTPLLNKTAESFIGYFNKTLNNTKTELGVFYDLVLNVARKNANERIKEEKRIQDAMIPNPNALRGGKDEPVNPLQRKRLQIIGGDESASTTSPVLFFGQIKKQREGLNVIKKVAEKVNETVTTTTTGIEEKLKTTATGVSIVANKVEDLGRKTETIDFGRASASATFYETSATASLSRIENACLRLGDTIVVTQTTAWNSATDAVRLYAKTAIAELNAVSAAQSRTQARTGVGSIDESLATGRGTTHLSGFASGGYTGNRGRNQVAGLVHGQEFVVNAAATARNRQMLESINSGRSVAPAGVNVTIENHSSATHEVQQISATEVRIIARQEASSAVARDLSNPNSQMSKSIKSNLRSKRRR